MKALLAALLTGLVGLWSSFAAWAEPAQGSFIASQRCEAFQSIRKQTNPMKWTPPSYGVQAPD